MSTPSLTPSSSSADTVVIDLTAEPEVLPHSQPLSAAEPSSPMMRALMEESPSPPSIVMTEKEILDHLPRPSVRAVQSQLNLPDDLLEAARTIQELKQEIKDRDELSRQFPSVVKNMDGSIATCFEEAYGDSKPKRTDFRPPGFKPLPKAPCTGKASSPSAAARPSPTSSSGQKRRRSPGPTGSQGAAAGTPTGTARKKTLASKARGLAGRSRPRLVHRSTDSLKTTVLRGNEKYCCMCAGRLTLDKCFGYVHRKGELERALWPVTFADSSSEDEASASEERSETSSSE